MSHIRRTACKRYIGVALCKLGIPRAAAWRYSSHPEVTTGARRLDVHSHGDVRRLGGLAAFHVSIGLFFSVGSSPCGDALRRSLAYQRRRL